MGPMPPSADLFVVCKQCGSEVSPYITECPYCGHRLRQRAPKLPRARSRNRIFGGFVRRPALTRSGASLGRGRPGASRARRSTRGASPSRAAATIALVIAGCGAWVAVSAGYVAFSRLAIVGPLHHDWWKLFSSQFAYVGGGLYAFIAILATAIFGWLLERRRGPAVVLLVFFAGGVTGALVALARICRPDRQRRQRGGARAGRRLGDPRSRGRAPRLLLRRRPARRRCDRFRAARAALRASGGELAGGRRRRRVGLTLGLGLHLVDPPEL